MQVLGRNLNLIKYNYKILLNINTIVAIVFILATPFFFSLTLLSYDEISKIAELYLPISGIILLTYVSNIEVDQGVHEISYIKPISNILIFILRLVLILVIASVLVGGILYYSKLQGGTFPYWEIFLGSIITTLYLGIISLTITNISSSTPLGYLISICYFMFEYMTGGEYTRDFYVFSLLRKSFDGKYNILILIIIMLMINLVAINKKS